MLKTMIRTVAAAAALLCAAGAQAFSVPSPCDFVTGSGYVVKDDGGQGVFAVEGGCKNGRFWGDVDYVDVRQGFHFKSTRILGYTYDRSNPGSRSICGVGRVNGSAAEYFFRVFVDDNGEPGTSDTFGIVIDAGGSGRYLVLSRVLGKSKGNAGNIQLHMPNKSTWEAPPFDEAYCGGVAPPERPR